MRLACGRVVRVAAGVGRATLATLLEPYFDPNPGQAGRLVDVPPRAAAAALELVPVSLRVARLNGTQPPMRDLVALAAEVGDRLVGGPARAAARR